VKVLAKRNNTSDSCGTWGAFDAAWSLSVASWTESPSIPHAA
jgi:hypothetical protein